MDDRDFESFDHLQSEYRFHRERNGYTCPVGNEYSDKRKSANSNLDLNIHHILGCRCKLQLDLDAGT